MAMVVEATYHGGRDNAEGEVFAHMTVDHSQWIEVAKFMRLNPHQQVVLMGKWNGTLEELGIYSYNGKTDQPDGDYTLHFRSDLESVNADFLMQLKRACAGKKIENRKTFQLVVMTLEEVQAKLKDDMQDEVQEEESEEIEDGAEIKI